MRGPVVTISRQHGSGGEDVAALVAQQLGVPVMDQEIRRLAADRAGVSERFVEEAERPVSFITRMLERLGSVGIMADGGAVETATPLPIPTSETFRSVLEDVVRETAESGSVILGHAAHVTLRDQPGVLRVFVQAPIDARIARVVREQRIPQVEARKQIETQDRERVRFYHDTYHVNWYDTRLYDCVVDTHLLGVSGAAEVVLAMAERVCAAPAEPAASPAVTKSAASTPAVTAPAVPPAPTAGPPAAAPPAPEGELVSLREGTVRIRPMTSGDAGALLALFRSLPPEDLLFLRRDVTNPLVVEAWERDVVDGKMLTLLAETDPQSGERPAVVGEASLRRSEVPWTSHVGEVRAIVAPSHRNVGLGFALLREILRAAQDAGIEKVTAETMAEQKNTRRLLSRLGFIEEGLYAGYARDLAGQYHDLVVMTFTRPTDAGEDDA
jgi:cytidylate kinase/RimJ/RimL family protein N-acetyltransferase